MFKVPNYIRDIPPYPLGRDYEERQIRLSANENPLGPPPKAIKRIHEALQSIHRYPNGWRQKLLETLARKLGIAMENLVLGNGSNEVVEMVVKAFLREGDEVLVSRPSYAYYGIAARMRGAVVREVPLKDFKVNLKRIAEAVTDATRVIFLDNPNNPTGTVFLWEEFFEFVQDLPQDLVVVMDQAYAEFVKEKRYPSVQNVLELNRPVLLLRTFSKFYGLAGLRIGYGIGQRELVEVLNRCRQPFNVSSLAMAGALGALEDEEFQQSTKRLIDEGKRMLEEGFQSLGIDYIPSEANFYLIKVKEGKENLLKLLEVNKIVLRDMRGYGLEGFFRVTVGTPEENRRLLEVLTEWKKGLS